MDADGTPGRVGLLRNCRDADGNIYGAQENYEAIVARGLDLLALRICLGGALVVSWAVAVALWVLLIVVLVPLVPALILLALAASMASLPAPGAEPADPLRKVWKVLGTGLEWAELTVSAPLILPWLLALRAFAFRRPRRTLTAFLVSRPVVVGTGTLDGDVFGLSEKGPAVRRVLRWTAVPGERPIFDFGNLCKPLLSPFFGRLWAPLSLAAPRQRLQLGLSSGNRADVAEFLKVGVFPLLLDLCESGDLDDAPRLHRPVPALHAICADPTLRRRVPTSHGPMSALELQRWYLQRARRWVGESTLVHPEAQQVLGLWAEVLDGLEADPTSLSGVLDWPTKRALIDAGRDRVQGAALKKIDLRYHELGPEGYFTQLRDAGLSRRLIDDESIERAVFEPPSGSPAWQRSQLMRDHADDRRLRVAWDSIRTGRGLRGQVIPIDRFR